MASRCWACYWRCQHLSASCTMTWRCRSCCWKPALTSCTWTQAAATRATFSCCTRPHHVPWWHARGHRVNCCLRNSGLYLPGAGRRVGETCEQLWAQLKPLTSITRYMAKPNYQDCIDDFLGFVAAARLEEFVPFMVGQRKSLVCKLEECRNRYLDLVVLAGQQGLTEMQLLHAALDRCGRTPAAAPAVLDAAAARLKLLYVRVNQQRTGLQQVQQHATALAVALPGSEGPRCTRAARILRGCRSLQRSWVC
ncbi:hypothetical protein COO60DRAFT_1703723 [Scenedesmus sp. NREL 46B-D3]|nr:hypothetical protein COO60DRAFT_1703723 [Scenedesmus sp. NREL 46B-D3]